MIIIPKILPTLVVVCRDFYTSPGGLQLVAVPALLHAPCVGRFARCGLRQRRGDGLQPSGTLGAAMGWPHGPMKAMGFLQKMPSKTEEN